MLTDLLKPTRTQLFELFWIHATFSIEAPPVLIFTDLLYSTILLGDGLV